MKKFKRAIGASTGAVMLMSGPAYAAETMSIVDAETTATFDTVTVTIDC